MQSFLRIIKPRNTISVFISNPNSLLHTSPTPSPPSAAPTTTQYDELVNEAGRARNLRRVRFLLIQRINDGRFSSKDTFRFITNAQSSIDLIDEVFQCIASLPKGIPRRSALEAFVGRLCKIGLIKDALQVLDKMRQRNLEINAYSFHPVLSALSIKKDTDAAMRVLEGMKAVGTNPDTTAYNYILTAYCSIGDVIKAAELLEGMEGEKRVKADMRTYDALVLGACRAGKVETGVAIVRVAVDNGVRLIHSTYAHVIKALLDEGYYEQAMKFVMSFAGRDEGVDKENFELLGNGFLKLGRVEDVKRVVGEMVQRETNRQDTDAVPEQRSPATEGGSPEKARIFNYRELATATRNFHRKEFLGEGGFGTVYKGILRTGETVAVKRLNPSSLQGEKEFQVEILMLSLLRHPNLVNMIGYCSEGNQRLLVLEFMPLGSLEQHLHDLPLDQEPLDWSTRMNIAAGAARGVDYLHNEADPPVIFRDLKPSNILLDEGYHPKLSDFGLARFGPVGDQSHVSTRVVGTHGYCAPEYFNTGRLTPKSDTYSFGVVLLEIISGKKAYDQARGTGKTSLVEWARPLLKDPKNYVLFADPKLKGEYSKSRLWRAVQVATMCVNENAKSRPTMHEVASAMDYLVTGTPGFTLSKLGHGPNLSPRISPRSPGKSPLGRSPLSPGESPLSRGKSPLSTERSPLSPRKSPLRLVSPLSRVKSPLSPRKSPLRPEISALSRGKSPLSPGRSPLSPAKSPKISPHDADKDQSLAEAKMWGKELREKIRQGAGSSSNSYSASADSFSSSLDNLAGLIT